MASLGSLVVSIGADVKDFADAMTGVDSILDGIGKSAADSLGKFDSILSGGLGAGAAGVVAAISTMALEAGEAFETAFNTIIDKTGAENEKLASLEDSFKNVFTGVPESAGNVADAISLISIRLGVTGDALDEFTTKSIKLSQVTGEQLQPQIESITKALLNWSVAQSDFGDKEELLLKIHQETGVAVTSLADQLSQVGNIARLAGESFDETAIRLGSLNKQGLDGADAYMALQRAQALLTKSGSDEQITLNDLIFTVQKAIDAHNGLQVAVDLIGSKSGPKFFELIRDGKLDVDSLTKAIAESQTSIAKTWAETETFGKKLQDLKNNIEAVLAPLGNLALEAGKNTLDWANFFLAAVQGNSKAMSEFVGQANGAADAALRAKYMAQDAAAAAEVESAMYVNSGAAKAKSLQDVMALEEAAKASKAALGKASADIAKADADYADFLKTTYIPAVLSVGDATNNVQAALKAYTAAEIAEADARQARALNPSDVALMNALKDAELAAKDAKEKYTEAIKDQTLAKTTLATVTKDLQSAEDAIAMSEKAAYVPAILDHITALNNIAVAEENRKAAILDVMYAEENLKAAYDAKDTDAIKAAEDALTLTKKNLATATTALVEANKDETTSANLLSSALKEIDADELAALATKKLIAPAITDITTAQQNYEAALKDVQDASEKLTLAEIALSMAQASSDPKDLAAATKDAAAARGDLTLKTKELNDATGVLSGTFHVSADVLALIRQHMDDWTESQKLGEEAMSQLGIKSAAVLQDIANKTTAAYNVIANDPYAGVTQRLQALIQVKQADINLAQAQGQNTVLLQAQMDNLSAALQRQKDGWVDIWTAGKRFGSDIGDALKDIFTNIGDIGPALMDAAKTFASIIFDNKTLLDIQRVLKTDLTTALKDLITGVGNVGDAFKKLGTDVLDIILNKIIALGIQKMLDLLAGVGGVIGAIGTALGGAIGGVAGASGQIAALGTNTGAVTANTAALGALTSALSASTGASAAGDAGSAAGGGGGLGGIGGAVGGILGSVTGIVGAIGSVATAIGTFVEGGAMNDKLFKILNDTDRMDLALEKNGSESIFSYVKQTWQLTSEQKDFNFGILHPDLANLQTYAQLTNNYLKNIEASMATLAAPLSPDISPIVSKLDTINQSVLSLGSSKPSNASAINPASANTESDAEVGILNQILALMGTGLPPLLAAIEKGQATISSAMSAWTAPAESTGYDAAQQAIANTLTQMLAVMNTLLAPVLTAIGKSIDLVGVGMAAGQAVLQDIASTLKQTANAIVSGLSPVLISVEKGVEKIAETITEIASAPVQAENAERDVLDQILAYLGNGLSILTSTEKAAAPLGQLGASSLAVGQDIASSLHEAFSFLKSGVASILASMDRSTSISAAIESCLEATWQLASDQKSFNLGILQPGLVNLQAFSQLADNYLKDIGVSTAALAAAFSPAVLSIDTRLDTLNQSLASLKSGSAAPNAPPVFKIILNGQELLQSMVVSLNQSGTVAPAV